MQTPAQRKQAERDRKKADGWIYFGAWIRPRWAKRIKDFISSLGA